MTFREERIGDCRLILGDCLEVMPKIERADHVITDPPFEKEAHTAMRRTQGSIKTGELAALNFGAIDDDTRLLVAAWSKMKCDGWLLAFCQVEAVASWRDAMEVAGLKYKRGMVWVKPDSSPQFNGQMPAQGFECIASAWCGAGHSSWNGGGRRGVFTHNTNWPGRHGVHPTEKPVPLMTELVGLFTDMGQTILDPFMGSGSTLVACARLGRAAIGIEKDPEYFRVACERVEAATRQSDLFIAPPQQPVQEGFDL